MKASKSTYRKVSLIALVLSFLGIVFPASAQLVTNQPGRFKTKVVVWEGKVGASSSSTTVDPSPEFATLDAENTNAGTSPGREYELKWKYVGRNGDKDLYRFTFTRTTKAGVPDKTTTSKEISFDGKRATVFEDDLHTVIIETPGKEDLK